MSKKPSLAAALQTFDRAPAAAAAPTKAARPQRRQHKDERAGKETNGSQAPSRFGKKALIGYFDPGVSKQLKQIALDKDRTVQDLLTEALNDFFQKHKKPTIA
jgi:Antitoxin-like ribbon-helix-helix